MQPSGQVGVVHLPHPLHYLWVFLQCLEEVDELLACGTREHGNGLPRKTCGSYFLNEVQHHAVLDAFPEKIGFDESRGAEGGDHDVDAVVVGSLPVAAGVRFIRQSASSRDALNLEGQRRFAGCGL